MQERLTVPPRIQKLVKGEVEKAMKPSGLTHVDVRAGEDHDGDPVIFIDATYRISTLSLDPSELNELHSRLRQKLWQAGETRFPHIRHRFPDGQMEVGYGRIHNNRAASGKGKTKQAKRG
jgi:hypothetical protein